MTSQFVYNTPFGPLSIVSAGDAITHVALGNIDFGVKRQPDQLTNACADQLLEYFAGKRSVFDVPIRAEGTAFQQLVWDAICRIPYAHERSCEEIARTIGKPTAFRLVGGAVNRNPLAILIPAHRVANRHAASPTDRSAKLRAAFRELERMHA